MSFSTRRRAERLIPALEALRSHALAVEQAHAREMIAVHPDYRPSAGNLLHYLAVRQGDIRDVQNELALLGLSRLGRAEAHILSSLDAVLRALCPGLARVAAAPSAPGAGQYRRRGQAARCPCPGAVGSAGRRTTCIMVTMPSEAAHAPDLIRRLLEAGMDVMRINCAHDDAEARLAMIRNLRAAEAECGRRCCVYADLAGPKLRTGDIRPVGRLIDFKPRRDVWGRVVRTARVLLRPRGQSAAKTAGDIDAVLPLEAELLA